MARRRLEFSQALLTPKELNLKSLAMPGVLKNASFLGWGVGGAKFNELSEVGRGQFLRLFGYK